MKASGHKVSRQWNVSSTKDAIYVEGMKTLVGHVMLRSGLYDMALRNTTLCGKLVKMGQRTGVSSL